MADKSFEIFCEQFASLGAGIYRLKNRIKGNKKLKSQLDSLLFQTNRIVSFLISLVEYEIGLILEERKSEANKIVFLNEFLI